MKRLLVVLLLPVLLLSSCVFDFDINTSAAAERKKIEAMSPEIIRCFVERDKATLMDLFCPQVRDNPDFSQQIDLAFEYFRCDEYWGTRTIPNSAGGGKAKEDGKVTEWYVWPQMHYVATFVYLSETETIVRVYNFSYTWMIFNQDKSIEGLHEITIELVNVDEFMLGEYIEF